MADDADVPTQREIWDFLVTLKDVTQSGFSRLETKIDILDARVGRIESRVTQIESQVTRIQARLARIEGWNVNARLDDHEERLLRLEEHPW